MSFRTLFIIFCLSLAAITKAATENPCVPISELPFTIGHPGTYCLTKDLVNTGDQNALTIAASGVVLDLRRHTISSDNQRKDNPTFGIFSVNCRDIHIKNGTIQGFMYGIYLADKQGSDAALGAMSGGHRIDGVTIKDSLFRGIRIEGAYNTVQKSKIIGVGGTTIFDNAFAMGIETIGPGAVIAYNSIQNIYASGKGESVALSFSNNASGSSAFANVIDNTNKSIGPLPATGNQFGIWVGGNERFQTNVYVRNNTIRSMHYGITFSSPTTGWYSNNQMNNIYICPYVICSTSVSTLHYQGQVCCDQRTNAQIHALNHALNEGKTYI